MVKGDPEMPGEVTANNRFITKHANNYRIYSRVSKLCNFRPAKVCRSKDARYLISQGKTQIAIWGFAIRHQTFGDDQIAIKAGIQERLNSLSALIQDNSDGNIPTASFNSLSNVLVLKGVVTSRSWLT